jgi:hypothetical protein
LECGGDATAFQRRSGSCGAVTPMNELIFLVEEAPEGGYTARALGESIFTEAGDAVTLEENVRDAVRCHFDEGTKDFRVRWP